MTARRVLAVCALVCLSRAEPGSEKFVSSLIHHLNKLPGQSYTYREGTLLSAQEKTPYTYKIEAKLDALCNNQEQCQSTSIKCEGFLEMDTETGTLYVINNDLKCIDGHAPIPNSQPSQRTQQLQRDNLSFQDLARSVVRMLPREQESSGQVAPHRHKKTDRQPRFEIHAKLDLTPVEAAFDSSDGVNEEVETPHSSVQLTHEVQPFDKASSGEQFVAVRRVVGGNCDDCASDVDINATGVDKLATLALHHLDRHDVQYLHQLNNILRVQRQVQVVNGVRYTLLLEVMFTIPTDGSFADMKICKVSILEKPWLKLNDGSKFRAVVSNNCTEQYLFGDSGEVVPPSDRHPNNLPKETAPQGDQAPASEPFDPKVIPNYDSIANSGKADDILKVVQNQDLQIAKPNAEMPIDPERFEDLLSQIIPEKPKPTTEKTSLLYSYDNVPETAVMYEIPKVDQSLTLSNEKKAAIDDFMKFFDADLTVDKPKDESVISYIRRRRRIFDMPDEYFISLANLAMETLDNFDADDKKRIVLDVVNIKTVQLVKGIEHKMQLIVGYSDCPESAMFSKECLSFLETNVKICQVKIYVDERGAPKVTESHCEKESSRRRRRDTLVGALTPIPVNESEVVKLTKEALREYNRKSNLTNYHKIIDVKSAHRQLVSGLIYRIQFEIGYTDCLKSNGDVDLSECKLHEGYNKLCNAKIYTKPWLNQIDISVTCENLAKHRPKRHLRNETILDLLSEAIKHIENSHANPNKQKVDKVLSFDNSRSADLLHRIKFTVGVTNCSVGDLKYDRCVIHPQFGPSRTCTIDVDNLNGLEPKTPLKVECDNDHETDSLGDIYSYMKTRKLFAEFIAKYEKSYKNDEVLDRRFRIFHDNLKIIKNLQFHEQGTATYGINQFADMTTEEFKQMYTGLRRDLKNENDLPMPMAEIPSVANIPDSFDWRDKGAVTEVKNQGQCGSCWAFSVTGNIEGQWKLKRGELLSLSEQELVDCDTVDEGCNGGLPDNAYRAIEKLGGLELEKDYPYDAEDETCHFNKTLARVQVSGALNISSNETEMKSWLYANGPISIGINANAMQFYMGGVSHPWKILCNPETLDHGVLIVGYGIHDYPLFHKKLPFWTIKNSWGDSWGEQGYYRVYRGDGTCGVNQMASSAIVPEADSERTL